VFATGCNECYRTTYERVHGKDKPATGGELQTPRLWADRVLKDCTEALAEMRTFESGATRDEDSSKPDYEGYLSPLVVGEFGKYMTKHRKQADGNLRESDNWQKGIPLEAYIKSAWRHFLDIWFHHRGFPMMARDTLREALCALLFNIMGYLHEVLKEELVTSCVNKKESEETYKQSCASRTGSFEIAPCELPKTLREEPQTLFGLDPAAPGQDRVVNCPPEFWADEEDATGVVFTNFCTCQTCEAERQRVIDETTTIQYWREVCKNG
jgi:hypothetical protein